MAFVVREMPTIAMLMVWHVQALLLMELFFSHVARSIDSEANSVVFLVHCFDYA